MTKSELAQLFLDYLERQDEQRLGFTRVPKSRRTARITFWLHNDQKNRRVIDVSELRKFVK